MEVLHQRCAGLDVHKATVVGCLRVQEHGRVRHEVRRWGTTTAELLALGDWLRQAGCTHVAMRRPASTGSRCGTSWRVSSTFSSPTRRISVTYPGAKATLTMRPGSRTCWRMG